MPAAAVKPERTLTRMLLKRCLITGTNLKLQCKQLNLKMVLTLPWPLVIKFALPPQAEVVAEATAEVEQTEVVVKVCSDLPTSR